LPLESNPGVTNRAALVSNLQPIPIRRARLKSRIGLTVALAASVGVLGLAYAGRLPDEWGSPLEVLGVVTGGWSVWLLARNHPLGWWVGLVMVAAYGVVFYRAQLYGEVILQVFYFGTSLQAIVIWLRGGQDRGERPVARAPRRLLALTAPVVVVAVVLLRGWLVQRGGAAPFWDALTTVLSVTAHLLLMGRYVESWLLWITVDVVYIPLYASRGLHLTSGLYGAFLLLAIQGLLTFRRLVAEGEGVAV